MSKAQEKAIKELIESNKSDLISKGINHHIKLYGLQSTQKSHKIKKKVNELLKSDDLKAKSRGLKLFETLYQTKRADEKIFIKSPEYKILMANAGLLTSMI